MPMLALPLEDYLESGNKSSPRGSSHGLDSLIHRQSRSKRISNWMGYKALGQRWQASNNIGRAVSVAHQGLGYSTQWAWDSGPQQLYVASQPSQAPQGGMVKAAVAHRPDLWVSSAVINAVNGVTPTRTNTSVTHVNLMPEGGTKHVDIGPEKYVEKYSYAGMPTEYPRVGYAVPDGCTIERTANGRALRFLDSDGVQYMHTQDAYGWWGTAEVSMLMPNTGGVELVPQGTQQILGKTYHIFDLVPVAAEWSDSFGQVHIDPTTVISGAPGMEDNYTTNQGGLQLTNYGTVKTLPILDATTRKTPIWRVVHSSLPGGTTTSAKIAIYHNVATSGDIQLHRILNGNAAWGELTSSWAYKDGAASWLGGASGCSTVGTDLETTPDSERTASIPTGYLDYAINPSTIDGWTGDPVPGMAFRTTTTATASYHGADQIPGFQPVVTIEYEAPLGNPHYYYNMLKRRR